MDKKMEERFEEIKKKRKDLEETPMEWPKKEDTLKIFKASGFKCAICKNPGMGNINGYVLIPKEHPDCGKGYEDIDVSVHGGLTFGQKDTSGGCWYGFDTAHAGDFIPGMPLGFNNPSTETHWDIDMVQQETERLAEQFKTRVKLR